MKCELVVPVSFREDPIYRVRLWTPPTKGFRPWYMDEWELSECDLDEVLAWAEQQSHGNPYELFVRAGSPDFYRLRGEPADDGGTVETVYLYKDDPDDG